MTRVRGRITMKSQDRIKISLLAERISAVSFTLGKGMVGSNTPRNLQRGPQPSFTSHTSNFSSGTTFLTSAICSSKNLIAVSLLPMMSSLPLFVATVAAFLVVSGAEHHRNILVTTTVNETHCMAASNEGQFYHYGVALAGNHDANPAVLAVQYEGLDVTCCEFNLVNNSTMSFEDVSSTTGPTPCSDLKECQENGGCDENATCVYGETGVFQCQCTDLYEGDGSSC